MTEGPAGGNGALAGRTALVTGANRGLGRAVAMGLAARGAKVLLACRSDASEVLDAIRRAGGRAEALDVDLADLRRVEIGRASCRERVCQYV